MTDKHIPASKLLALLSDADVAENYDNSSYVVSAKAIRAIIDEAPESVVMTSDEDCPCCGEGKLVYTYCNSCGTELAHPRKEEQDDEAVSISSLKDRLARCCAHAAEYFDTEEYRQAVARVNLAFDQLFPLATHLHTRPAPKHYTEQDIDVAIGAVDWANTSWQQAAVEAKKLVMRFVGMRAAPPDNTVQELRGQVAELEKSNIALRLQYSGAIGLLCTVSTNLRENGMKADILDAIEQSAIDFAVSQTGGKLNE